MTAEIFITDDQMKLMCDIFIVFHLSTIYLQFIKVLHKQYAFNKENYKYSHTYRNMQEREIQT